MIFDISLYVMAAFGLFAMFLAARVGPEWEATGLEEIRTWIKKRQPAGESATLH